jgi:hypothetical protein
MLRPSSSAAPTSCCPATSMVRVSPPSFAHHHLDRRGPVRSTRTSCHPLQPRSRSCFAQLRVGPGALRGEPGVGRRHPHPAPPQCYYVITTSLLHHYFIINTLNLLLLHHYCIPITSCYSWINDLLLYHYHISTSITTSLLPHYYNIITTSLYHYYYQ